ncbi:MAG TPA: DUF1622 domain-containing protein [Rhodocyclaceae bacterium]|nr:DUF1622 domain-containing protein [Rhodocyclaceae bacterium]
MTRLVRVDAADRADKPGRHPSCHGRENGAGAGGLPGRDIVQTVVVPTWNSLAIRGSIVVIRTVIVYFLNLELSRGPKHGNA